MKFGAKMSDERREEIRLEKERGEALVKEMDALLNKMKEVADSIENKINCIK